MFSHVFAPLRKEERKDGVREEWDQTGISSRTSLDPVARRLSSAAGRPQSCLMACACRCSAACISAVFHPSLLCGIPICMLAHSGSVFDPPARPGVAVHDVLKKQQPPTC